MAIKIFCVCGCLHKHMLDHEKLQMFATVCTKICSFHLFLLYMLSFFLLRTIIMAASRPGIPQLLASQTSTPRLTPPGSPPSVSGSASPTRTSMPVSPRKHSVSFSTSRGMFDDRPSMSSSDPGSQIGRTRVDGKEFFRQARSRLSYEQFGAFLSNVKEFNSHKQTKEETLRKANEIFGSDNRDLYAIFEGLINRTVH
ncbi:PH-response transcription factor pacC/RIM101 isoform 2 [Gossypium australe]|uniref:PH-response transcription factor pacC/RIM101 isoform 2 n=1 Tax=Gossypium australe TaxID=47621 RepID=A0A5B6WVG3_9ROSI|nr:PH-response transcription factor pacC/RIM101 isoform 2 [Gossypium australe]